MCGCLSIIITIFSSDIVHCMDKQEFKSVLKRNAHIQNALFTNFHYPVDRNQFISSFCLIHLIAEMSPKYS